MGLVSNGLELAMLISYGKIVMYDEYIAINFNISQFVRDNSFRLFLHNDSIHEF